MIKFTVKTVSGSVYEFTQENDRTFFRKGILAGEVARIKNGPITIGKEIHMDFYKEGLFCEYEKSPMFIHTTPVAEISIVL